MGDLDAARFEPRREEAVVEVLINDYQPEHIFMPDNALGDGDLGRRLIAKLRTSAATHVSEIDGKHVAVGWSGGGCLADAPLPCLRCCRQARLTVICLSLVPRSASRAVDCRRQGRAATSGSKRRKRVPSRWRKRTS
ncbi:hypothetical protein [Bradyrhizobium sp. RDI18]|uniref:hypothetical protein n=1 Tax=Bradyrhizobium sp. RDI18 TaxID=3367400 RepID=UPI0037122C91